MRPVLLLLGVCIQLMAGACQAAQLHHHAVPSADSKAIRHHSVGSGDSAEATHPHHRHRHGHHHTTTPTPASVDLIDTSDLSDLSDLDYDGDELLPRPGTYIASNCSSCIRREEVRMRNLEVIKDQILSKLGMRTAPNMTGRHPPRIPPLDHLLDLYGMQGDAPQKGFQPGPLWPLPHQL